MDAMELRPLQIGIRFFSATIIFGGIVVLFADPIAGLLSPVVATAVDFSLPPHLTLGSITLSSVENVPVFQLHAIVPKAWRLGSVRIPADSAVQITMAQAHLLLHVVLIAAIACAVPAQSMRHWSLLLGLALGAIVLAIGLDSMTVLSADAYHLFYETYDPKSIEKSLLIKLEKMLDHGGRMMLSGMLGLLVVFLSSRRTAGARPRK